MATAAVIPAAGAGARLGRGMPKALVCLNGEPLLVHAVRGTLASSVVDEVVVVAPEAHLDQVRALLSDHRRDSDSDRAVSVVAGGPDRVDSVRAGLAVLDPTIRFVLVHDAARCLAPGAVFRRVHQALAGGAQAVIPVLPLVDTVKFVEPVTAAPDGADDLESAIQGTVVGTPSRSGLRIVQTPQGFDRELLQRAHRDAAAAGISATDDAMLVERLGVPVATVAGDERSMKITSRKDLAIAELLLSSPS
ncbi:2-C-methyl-D-erythritol 4-phosphate cytidylyltransferase [Saxibacter everestensis]|uniref:2-C-methyl-D-erythritol 4-phosphate cytidylyltransferase n=1 Tax=Saxibacter everestensis TaxID=2909229 RepID=A0ABY8QUQ8_9MICO|nr:2-C-methyl-D-erythritol 4-phosphate cytidylyltransferase [Brevibacteriaceae bacterium ZFBP1038]